MALLILICIPSAAAWAAWVLFCVVALLLCGAATAIYVLTVCACLANCMCSFFRKLVGLCWQHHVAPDGSGEWTFQKAPEGRRICTMDYRVFWGGLVAWALLWVALCINSIISLDFLWTMMAIVGVVLSGTNFLAYYKCSRAQSPADAALTSLHAATWRHAVLSRLGLS
ncbi:Golgi apparatus membrane protein TVP23 homolog B [Cyclospora cayetanensis]|uniref:Golgi apparatus membrane protein TVP23 homolog n=1 Tax=Cyclospora cayetanensis TaxID=88456 RepID=A0A6P6RYV2_9EIME|nr:Golgi apparatus membrane protein TVP23 homolog B [Cyclospora cayetanensis]